MVVSLLAVLKAGAAYLPLDPDQPPERLAYMLHDAQPGYMLTIGPIAQLLPGQLAQLLLDHPDTQARLGHQPALDPVDSQRTKPLRPQHPAYVIYTSGSTGIPKGVVVIHRAIANRLLWMQSAYKLQSDDRILQKASVGVDVSVWEFFWPLTHGATLVITKPGGQRDRAYLTALICAEQVTTVHFCSLHVAGFLARAYRGPLWSAQARHL
jgi:nonribosomal peptide synthetase DhbF